MTTIAANHSMCILTRPEMGVYVLRRMAPPARPGCTYVSTVRSDIVRIVGFDKRTEADRALVAMKSAGVDGLTVADRDPHDMVREIGSRCIGIDVCKLDAVEEGKPQFTIKVSKVVMNRKLGVSSKRARLERDFSLEWCEQEE